MGLKGQAKIQLFDAKTGELTDEITSENIVTNAVMKLMNKPLNAIAMRSNYVNTSNFLTGILAKKSDRTFAQKYFGGILIFSTAIDEDVNHIIPSGDEIKACIGCGSQAASDTGNIYRGSINTDESVVGDDYVTFVWDFTTQQCNGDIASICLTSDVGGINGWCVSSKTSDKANRMFWNPLNNTSLLNYDSSSTIESYSIARSGLNLVDLSNGFNTSYGSGYYIYKDYLYCIFTNEGWKFDISKLLNGDYGLKITDDINFGHIIKNDSNYSYTFDTAVYNGINCCDQDCCYLVSSWRGSNDTFTFSKYYSDFVKKDITITLTDIKNHINEYIGTTFYQLFESTLCTIYKEKIYIFIGRYNNDDTDTYPDKGRMYVLNFDGTFTYKDVNFNSNMIAIITEGSSLNGRLPGKVAYFRDSLYFVPTWKYTSGCVAIKMEEDGTLDTKASMLVNSSFGDYWYQNFSGIIDDPYVVQGCCNSSKQYLFNAYLVAPYLATINNMETVLTKTADKSMKIIYTLKEMDV